MQSARLRLPGDYKNVVKLNTDYKGVYRFGLGQINRDNFKLMRSNIRDIYNNTLKTYKLSVLNYNASRKGAYNEKSIQTELKKLRNNIT